MKTFQNPTIFMKNEKKDRKMNNIGIFECRIHMCDENISKSYDFYEK